MNTEKSTEKDVGKEKFNIIDLIKDLKEDKIKDKEDLVDKDKT